MAPFFVGLLVGLYAKERLRDARHETFELQRCISDCEANAILGNIGHRCVVHIFIGNFDVAATEVPIFILKRALKNQREFKPMVPMIRDCGACRDVQQPRGCVFRGG